MTNFIQGEIAAHELYKVGDMNDSQSQFSISTHANQCSILGKSVQLYKSTLIHEPMDYHIT